MTLALVFPGQASQEVGMGVALRAASPAIEDLFTLADQVTGQPIGRLCAEGPLEDLTRTDIAQTAVVVTSMAAALYFEQTLGGRPTVVGVAGHSVGELCAMWWAGAIDTETVLQLVHERGRLMARDSAACDGSMSAVLGLGETELAPICTAASERAGSQVQVANLNAPGQVVLSGDRAALAVAAELAQATGARRVIPLTVGGPFHSIYMEAAARDFAAAARSAVIRPPRVPIVLNTSAEPCSDPEALRNELTVQIVSSVRWEDSLHRLASLGCTTCLELGPGSVLAGMVKRTLPAVEAASAGTPEAIAKLVSLVTAAPTS